MISHSLRKCSDTNYSRHFPPFLFLLYAFLVPTLIRLDYSWPLYPETSTKRVPLSESIRRATLHSIRPYYLVSRINVFHFRPGDAVSPFFFFFVLDYLDTWSISWRDRDEFPRPFARSKAIKFGLTLDKFSGSIKF